MKRFSSAVMNWLLGVLFVGFAQPAISEPLPSPFRDFDQLASSVGFDMYARERAPRKIKIAILDNGFRGFAKELGRTLPPHTVYHAGPVPVDGATEESHGLFMAQIVSGLLSRATGVSYELHLFSSYGYSNLEFAVQHVIKNRFDIVLYAQVWEYGGNGDGRGFINTLVNRAIESGVLWVNAAGNFGNGTYRGPVDIGTDEWIKLPAANQVVRVRCEANATNECDLRVVLGWNDFKDDVKAGTDKDLDLILTDDTLKIVSSSAFQQMRKVPEGSPAGSLYPREIVQLKVKPGMYFVRIKARTQNFDRKRDWLRLTVSGDNVLLLDSTPGDSLLPPADNARVIAVGASDSEKSSLGRSKPDLFSPSMITLMNGDQYKGSSNASAIAAAAVGVLKAMSPGLKRDQAIAWLGSGGQLGNGLPLEVLRFSPTGQDCFAPSPLGRVSPAFDNLANWLSQRGGISVLTSKGLKILIPNDPFALVHLRRIAADDMLVLGSNGFQPWPRTRQDAMAPGFVEVVQVPFGHRVCSGGRPGAALRLPAPQRR